MTNLIGQFSIQIADDKEEFTQMQPFFLFLGQSFSTTLSLYSRGESPRDDRYAIVDVAFCFLMQIRLHNFVVDCLG